MMSTTDRLIEALLFGLEEIGSSQAFAQVEKIIFKGQFINSFYKRI